MNKTIICDNCKQPFETDWNDEDASVEFQQKFPGDDIRDADVVCDDCYRALGLGDE